MERLRVGILGATGMVGQQFAWRLAGHPWFQVTCLAASPRSAGRSYAQAVEGRWSLKAEIPQGLGDLEVKEVGDVEGIVPQVDFAFCALSMEKEKTRWLEEEYARREIPVVSANSAHRWTPDVPVLIPEVNADHLKVIPAQRQRLGTQVGFVAVKPNCSIQPYVPALDALRDFGPRQVWVCTYQALSGAGRTLATWPEMGTMSFPSLPAKRRRASASPSKSGAGWRGAALWRPKSRAFRPSACACP